MYIYSFNIRNCFKSVLLLVFLQENHGQPIFGVQVNLNCAESDPVVFATAAHNRVNYKHQPLALPPSLLPSSPPPFLPTCIWLKVLTDMCKFSDKKTGRITSLASVTPVQASTTE